MIIKKSTSSSELKKKTLKKYPHKKKLKKVQKKTFKTFERKVGSEWFDKEFRAL